MSSSQKTISASPRRKTALQAVVVGATGGIGQRIAVRLVENGYSVCAIGRSHERVQAVKEALDFANGGNLAFSLPPYPAIEAHVVDFSDDHFDSTLMEICHRLEEIDLLVVAHGASATPAAFDCVDMHEYRRVMDIDVWGTCVAIQRVLVHMTHTGGSIILLSSFHVAGTYPGRTVYNLAKHSISGLVQSLCCEYARYGINVNAIAPGQVTGERSDAFVEKHFRTHGQDLREKWAQRAPAGKIVDPEDIANTVLWLAKVKAVNGQTIYVDHGVTASNHYDGYGVQHGTI